MLLALVTTRARFAGSEVLLLNEVLMFIGITERGDAALDYPEVFRAMISRVYAGAVLITKAPHVLEKCLAENPPPIPYIVHCTITGWGGTIMEPNVAPLTKTIKAYHKLKARLGDRCVLRVDPIIPTDEGFTRACLAIREAKGGRVRISFLDNYAHVKQRFAAAGVPQLPYTMHAPVNARLAVLPILEEISPGGLEVCGEPGIACTGCISQRDLDLMGLGQGTGRKGQRKTCECIAAKREILSVRGPCGHRCLYCYWR